MTIGVSPHAPYTCSLETYRWCLSLGIPVGTHLAESASENEWLEHGTGVLEGLPILVPPTGKRAVASLEPVLGPELLCAHCVDVSGDEIALLAERNVPVAHCPRSNALLGCGVAPLTAMRAAGIVRRPRHRLAGLDAVVRRVRGDARGRLRRAGPRAAPRGPARGGRAAPGDRSTRPARCESTTGWVP